MSLRISLSLLLIALYACSALGASVCYTPNGLLNSSDKPCNASAPVSACCGDTASCLSNGMCKLEATEDTGISYARGTCTDKTWNSPACPPMCQINQDTPTNSSAYDFGAGGVQIWECGAQGYAKEAEYCCESQAERQRCCSTSSAVFTLPGATVGAFTGLPPSSSAVPTTRMSSSATSIIGSATTMTSTATSTFASLLPTSATPKTEPVTEKSNNGLMIGAGIGGGLGGLLLIAAGIFLFFWQKKRKQKAAESLHHEFKGQDDERMAYGGYGPVELPTSHDPHELLSHQMPQELPAEEIVHELPNRTSNFLGRKSVKSSKSPKMELKSPKVG